MQRLIIIIIIIYYYYFFFIALGTSFPKAEKLSNCVKKIKLYDVLRCASVGVLRQIV